MKKLLLAAGIWFSFFGFAALSGAQAMNSEGLNAKQQAIVPIAAFTASGDMERLKTALNEGLNAGLTINEIKEVLVQMYAYAGFPRSLNGLAAFMDVVETRERRGLNDERGREASPLPAGKSRLELGAEVQTRLSGAPVQGPLFTFAPAIDAFLKDHLFGDIFGRDNLDFRSREIATISALASLKGVNSQLGSHFRIGINVGLTETQLSSLISVLRARVGAAEADNAAEVLRGVLNG